MGDQRVCGMTIDDFCFCTGKDPERELTGPQKLDIVKERMQELNRTEWQRWTPVLGLYRILKDCLTKNNSLLTEMHSTSYNVANIAYNVSTLAGSGFLLDYGFF